MGKKIKIIECADQLGLGGTEYALQLYCKYLDKERFDVTAVGLYKGGEREKLISDLGINVVVLNGDFEKFETLIRQTDVFHWHGYGQVDNKLFAFLNKNKPRLIIQTNVFGHFEKSRYYDLIDFDLYISKMILVRRMKLDKAFADQYAYKRKVLPYPVDIDFLKGKDIEPGVQEVIKFKQIHNIADCFVVGRVGRADDHKFDVITLIAFKEYLKYNREAKFLLVGATKNMKAVIKKLKITDSVVILNNTSDMRQLLTYYKAMDVFLAASNIGESFGMVMAEAMSMGVPVVTISTPAKDNAQVEVVDNGVTGFVSYRLKETIARAINEISSNPLLAKEMGKNSIDKISCSYNAQAIVYSLEQLVFDKLGVEFEKRPSLIVDWGDNLKVDYKNRCNELFGEIDKLGKVKVWYYQTLAFKVYNKLSGIIRKKLS
ncbi:glycosyltransferase family 4 protein [Mucilaginibacter sp. KACC 22773]|uniref:glycosyltransferase family 4 protein n=1 Tax=Mucilaginibacter sp. KACC 22773 TaxID=3025671 RepID=UPI0023662BF7|nr:glycosyltransferase family 4 protein [Mucilaginibacter sp. KACC 22773]WDF77626.1 glycosyltransferase family 4 protein [Mucilaginibacter sp. KACC 22773]